MQTVGPPEIFIDLNAAMPGGYLLTNGSYADLAALGLDPRAAMGRRLRFVAANEPDDAGNPGDLYFDGVIVEDEKFGWLAVPNDSGICWRATS